MNDQQFIRSGFEVTKHLPTAGGVSGSEFTWNKRDLKNTIFDPAFAGKDVYIDLRKVSPEGNGYPMRKDGRLVSLIFLSWDIRKDLKKNFNGTYLMSPMMASANDLAGAVAIAKATGNTASIAGLVMRFGSAYAEELLRTMNVDLGRPRNPRSGNLVAVPDIRRDIFTDVTSFKRGFISNLRPGELGLPTRVMDKINNGRKEDHRLVKNGDFVLSSRWPCTDVVPMRIVENEAFKDDFVAYVSADWFTNAEHKEPIQQMKLVEGDNDGDTLFFNCVTDVTAVKLKWLEFVEGLFPSAFTPQGLTYKDHEPMVWDELQIAVDKADQKNWIMGLSAAMYAGFAFMEWRRANGLEVTLTRLEWCEAMTSALELCFDKKHNNNSDPRPLYGMLQAKDGYNWSAVVDKLQNQGLNIDVFYKMYEMLDGESLRVAASKNTAFRVMHQTRGMKTGDKIALVEELVSHEQLVKWFMNTLIPSLGDENA